MSQNTSSAVMQQREAKALGLFRYFTGKPCPRGHVSERLVVNWTCIDCINEKATERRAVDPDAARRAEREYHAAVVDRRRMQAKASRNKHIEKRQSEDRARYRENAARYKAAAVRWAKANPGKRVAMIAARRSWVKIATPKWLTSDHKNQIRALYLDAAKRDGEWHVDHVVPLRGKAVCGLNVPWNLEIITGDDNRKKGARHEA